MINIHNYRITKQIYESANSLVYRGLRDEDNQPIILKVLKEDYPSPEELTRYRQEYDITRRLADFSGVVKAYSLEKYQKTLVIYLEDFGGESLKMWLERRTFTLDELLTLAIRTTENLGQIHGQNIIHKDINPANLVFNPTTGVLKIIDFGISTQFSKQHLTLKNPDVLEGTLAYMSPEQTGRMNRALDYRTDFYSLGATFYELFTGVVPFESTDAMELVHCHIAKQPMPPSQINPDLPPVISNLILKLLEKTAEARYQSAWGIKADLERLQENLGGFKNLRGLDFELAQNDFSGKLQIPQKLYGREPEIDTLRSAFEQVASGKTEIMLVAGYSGIGKSVLVKEIYKSLTERQGYFITGKFDQLQRNIPYSAIVNAFSELVQQLLTETETQLTQWKERILTVLGPNGQVIIDVLPEIELIIGPQPSVPQLGGNQSQNRFNLVFQDFMRVFCQPERPVVIFLDDLQWVDSATLKLLELVTTDKDNTALFLIGAYRDNEVDATHPLMTTLDKLQQESVAINQITLKPLAFEHINQLIAESLHQNLEVVGSLTNLVMRKTGGNPFFVNQFLHTLYEEDLLTFQTSEVLETSEVLAFGWIWDIDQIETLNITDNVVHLMIGKLKKLPESAQQVLRLAACVGNHFDLDTLSVIYEKSAIDTFADLMPALTEGLILPQSELEMSGDNIHNSQFIIHNSQFLHDRVQQAAYALIDDAQKKAVHLQIGRLLLKNTPTNVLEEKVFDIVGHFNHSIELLNNPVERLEIAGLNLLAGQKAKMAMAHVAALNYLTVGRECLTDSSWESAYNLTFNLFIEAAEAAYLSGDFKQMEQLAQVVLQQARTLSDEAKVYETQIPAYSAQNQQLKAIKTALIFLKRLNINFPEEPSQEDVRLALQKMQISLLGKPIPSLIDLPIMTDPKIILAMRVMGAVTPAAYHVLPNLLILLALKQVDLSLEYGNVSESIFSYACYGFILCGVVSDIESGYQFGQLALDLLKKLGEKVFKARGIMLFNGLVRPWKEHVRETLQPLLGSYQIGLETGDLEFAAYSIHVYPYYSYFIGKPLVTLEPEMARYSQAIARIKQEGVLSWNNMFWQAVLNLMGHSNHPCRLMGEVYDENIQLQLHQQANDKTAIHYLHLNISILHYLFQEYTQAVENVEIAEQYLDGVTGLLAVVIFNFYDSLARLALYPSLPKPEQEAVLTKVSANQQKMQLWAEHAPMNYLHKFYLVEAECSRVLGKDGDAREFYDKAIALAHENEYLNEEALAYELAGQFYLVKEQTKFAQVCLHEAHYAYQQWGALAKVKNLETRYPQFLVPKTAHAMETDATILATRMASTSTGSKWLDLNSIMKASQTLSGEMVLSRLLEKMMHIVVENAGASSGFLLLPKQDGWFIEAQRLMDSSDTTVLHSLPIEDSEPVSANIIYYVARTFDNVVLNDATQEGSFTRDAYIIKHRPKSVLCTPLLNQGKLTGILYLENNLTTEAFTPARLEVLNLLSSQIAISIENSLLYNNLEQKVAERTQELSEALFNLKTTQSKLVESEKMASLGGLVAGVAHEINTPIGIGVTAASTLADRTTETVTAYDNRQLKGSALKAYFNMAQTSSNLVLNNLNRAADLIQSFKQVAVDQSNLDKRSFAMKKYIQNILISLKPLLKKTPHQITVSGEEQIEINSYPGAFSQIITNLVMNSVRHAYPKGEAGNLRFELKLDSKCLMVEYSDDGCGIPPENRDKIFEPFFTTARAQGGTGLGLHIVFNLVTQKLKGTINVQSEVGVGTTFILNLPLSTEI